jgi:hypothetical protein
MNNKPREYREGTWDDEPASRATSPHSDAPSDGPARASDASIAPPATTPTDSPTDAPQSPDDEEREPLRTAFILALRRDGSAFAITEPGALPFDIDYRSGIHDVFRICSDVMDQASSVRIVGQLMRPLVEELRRMGSVPPEEGME